MVPNLAKGVQPLVVRKYATDVLDDVENMVPKKIKGRIKDIKISIHRPY